MDKKDGLVEVGKITAAHGIRGSVKVFVHSGTAENLREGMEVLLASSDGRTASYRIVTSGMHGRSALVGFSGVSDRNAAEALVGRTVLVPEDELAELPEDTYYLRDLEGLVVRDADTDEEIGELTEVIQGPGQDVYRVRRKDGKEALVPAVKEFIRDISLEDGTIRIHFIEGMF